MMSFFREYPNFLGFNYCEQFWGYDDQFSVSWLQRVAHWNQLLKLTHKYGGYLVVSFCGNTWSANINPIALVKRNSDFAQTAKLYSENFIMCEKYTTQSGFFNVEGICLGTWLSGLQVSTASVSTNAAGQRRKDRMAIRISRRLPVRCLL